MTSLSAYTPLESLLLFQALRADGVTSIPFAKISDQLQGIPLIINDPSYDSARLSSEALRHLYLGLLKEEARRDIEQHAARQSDGQDGALSPNSKKRRAPSPNLPTVEEAAKHSHLIPKLVYRLYARYREKVVAEIREEEQRYDVLTREIQEIESGEWDDRLRADEADEACPKALEPEQNEAPASAPEASMQDDHERPVDTIIPRSQGDSTDSKGPQPDARASIDAVINHEPPASASPRQPRSPVATVLPPLSEMAPESPVPSSIQYPPTPQLPPPLSSTHGYHPSPPTAHHSPYMAQYAQAAAQGPSSSPTLQNAMGRGSPASPRPTLPLPHGMKYPPPSPSLQPGTPQHHRPPPPLQQVQYQSPAQMLPPVPLQSAAREPPRAIPPHMSTPPSYPQPFSPYQSRQAPYQPPPLSQQQQYLPQQHQPPPQLQQHQPPPQQYASRSSHQGGIQLPPFQVSAQEPNRAHQQQLAQQAAAQQVRPAPAPLRQPVYPPYPPYAHSTPQPSPNRDQSHLVNSVVSLLKKTSRPTWKPNRPSYLPLPQAAVSPVVEPLSPVKMQAPPPLTLPPEHSAPAENHVDQLEEEPARAQDSNSLDVAPRHIKKTRKSSRRSRAGSATPSVAASSTRVETRSHSVVSRAESQTAQAEPTPVVRRIKDEPTTPAEFFQDGILGAPTESTTNSKATRQRRGTLQKEAQSTSKGKRQRSASLATEHVGEPVPVYIPPPNNIILASRNFQRLSAVIMNDITTHRHAGPFQKPVREKDVEGYNDIIKRPQDLKSIKAAITTGTRAVSAAAAKDTTTDSPSATPSVGTSKESGGVITLERTTDLLPPRAIVNSSQLEKEVMRMFANAVMFNPGDGGMVQDAREMADDIEAKVRDWRGAERQVEGRDEDDDGAVPVTATGKRRKL